MAVPIYFNPPPHDSGRHDPLIHHCAGAMAMDAMKPVEPSLPSCCKAGVGQGCGAVRRREARRPRHPIGMPIGEGRRNAPRLLFGDSDALFGPASRLYFYPANSA